MELEITFVNTKLNKSAETKLTEALDGITALQPYSGLMAVTMVLTTQDGEHLLLNCSAICVSDRYKDDDMIKLSFDLANDLNVEVM